MKNLHTRILMFFLISSLLSVGLVGAQDDNLLINPGFESPFEVRPGSPDRNVATGWEPWHVPPAAGSSSAENQQPEYEEVAPDSARIRSGDNAQLYFTFFATHTGGVYQEVSGITPGSELRFSVFAYVWSSTFEDVNQSEQPGDVVVFVGIDPDGGTDGTSSDIIWSPPAPDQYDAYREYSVIAEAEAETVTVFIRSIVGFAVQNNNIYLDDATLTTTNPVATATEQATNTDVPTATETTAPSATPTNTVQPSATAGQPVNPTPTREGATPTGGQPTATQLLVVTAGGPTATFVPPSATPTFPLPTALTDVPSTPEPVITAAGTQVASVATVDATTFPNIIIHTVRSGDTVARLAVLYGSTVEAIIAENNLNSRGLIFVGQGLRIPVRLPAPATSTPSSTPVVVIVTATPVPDVGIATVAPNIGVGGGSEDVGGNAQVYIVRPGDTLSFIAAQFRTTVQAIAQLNGIVNPNRVLAGQRLLIPAPGTTVVTQPQPQQPVPAGPTSPPIVTVAPGGAQPGQPVPGQPPQPQIYIVQPGENLYRVSLRFGVTMRALANVNNITNVNLIFAGQRLIIP